MKDLVFETLSPDDARAFLTTVAHDMLPVTVPIDKTLVQVAPLPFYEDYRFYALTDMTLPAPNVRYLLYKPGDVVLMNWTNEPIYSVNEKAPIKLDRKSLVTYAKFFFHYVRGQLGRFIIVEKPEDVTWLDSATDEEKAKVAEHLKPVAYKGIGRDNLFTLTAIVVFKNALFKTDIKVAPYEMDVIDPETGTPEHFTIGQMKLTNEDLLLEDLNVPVDPPPGEFG
ncbi:MAG: hypothetical protein PHW63_04530 [Alphaproteobacteria bacterium]|nr:hypothetical protein [Alphaproteobacteria bacterium]